MCAGTDREDTIFNALKMFDPDAKGFIHKDEYVVSGVFRAEQKLPMTQADKFTAEEVETNVFIDVNIVLLRGEMLIDECCNIWILSSVLYWVLKVQIVLKQMDQSLHKYISWIYCSVRPGSILTLICGKQKTWNMARCRGGTKMLYLKSSNTT